MMRNLALDMAGSDTYTKFIVLGRSRTGSNFLRSLLNDHPQVETYGEIFRNKEAMDWDHIGRLQNDKMHQLLLNDPVKLVSDKVFRRYPKETAAVGFKIFYYHAQDPGWQAIWPYLLAQTDIHVIHMKRANILQTHLSRKRAELTDSWVNTGGEREKGTAVLLNYDECLADFERTRAYEEEYDHLFAAHPKIELIYEALSADYAGEMQRIQEFLHLPLRPVQPGTYKQSHKSLSQSITNYHELKEQFAGSPWEGFFTER
ncbi:MAG: sulfotransferase [Anaerolineales bacterium]|nr:sulfotransferase [Anaerolineales bacterium]MCB8990114.1 sulfotransferase [Ardenticatenaceae bacterium]